jgi:hypothetical protein
MMARSTMPNNDDEHRQRLRAAMAAEAKKHNLTDEQLFALRACNTIMGPTVSQSDALEELAQMGLIEQKLGGMALSFAGRAVLAFSETRLRGL